MTPRRLDPEIIGAKLRAIEKALDVLRSLGEVSEERLVQDAVVSAAVERLISRIVDLAVDTNAHVAVARLHEAPADYRSSFALAAQAGLIEAALAETLAPSVGMRNAIVHTYLSLDLGRLAAAVPLALTHYRRYVEQAATWTLDAERGSEGGPA